MTIPLVLAKELGNPKKEGFLAFSVDDREGRNKRMEVLRDAVASMGKYHIPNRMPYVCNLLK